MNLIKILSVALLITMAFSCQNEDDLKPVVADTQDFQDPEDITQEDLMAVIEQRDFTDDETSRKKHNTTFSAVLDPIDGGKEVGRSLLIRSGNNLTMAMKAKLVPRHAYTAWWVIFNKPENCTDPGFCGSSTFDDFFNPATKVAMIYADGGVTNSHTGNITFCANLTPSDREGAVNTEVLGTVPNRYLTNGKSSQVILVLRSHGPIIHDEVYEQTNSWAGGCDEPHKYPPFSIVPMLAGECADTHASIHLP